MQLSTEACSGKDKQTILDEVYKCKLLCSNCHREHHHDNRDSIDPKEAFEYINRNLSNIPHKLCAWCKKDFSSYDKTSKYCGTECYRLSKIKPKRQTECKYCKKTFCSSQKITKYCSTICRDLARRKPERRDKKCEFCKKPFFALKDRSKYCNKECFKTAVEKRRGLS
jgi:hypothetical protein